METATGGGWLVRNDGGVATLYLDNTEITSGTGAGPSLRYYTTSGGVMVGLRPGGTTPFTRVVLNHQGSTQYLVRNGTNAVKNIEYEPYGATRTPTSGLVTDRRYLHAPNDDTTGLIQLGARYYDPGLRQFISPDPLLDAKRPQTLNGYAYSLNNPTTYTDPTGLAADPGNGSGGTGAGGCYEDVTCADDSGQSGPLEGGAGDPCDSECVYQAADARHQAILEAQRAAAAQANQPLWKQALGVAADITGVSDLVDCVGGDLGGCAMFAVGIVPVGRPPSPPAEPPDSPCTATTSSPPAAAQPAARTMLCATTRAAKRLRVSPRPATSIQEKWETLGHARPVC